MTLPLSTFCRIGRGQAIWSVLSDEVFLEGVGKYLEMQDWIVGNRCNTSERTSFVRVGYIAVEDGSYKLTFWQGTTSRGKKNKRIFGLRAREVVGCEGGERI